MKTTQSDKWVYYTADSYRGFGKQFGKWMFYFDNVVLPNKCVVLRWRTALPCVQSMPIWKAE